MHCCFSLRKGLKFWHIPFGGVFMLAVAVFLCYLLLGASVSRLIFQKEAAGVRLWLGLVAGLAAAMWLPALFAFIWGMNRLSVLLSALFSLLVAFLFQRKHAKSAGIAEHTPFDRKALYCVLPLLLLSLYILFTHTLMPASDGSLHTGQATFGDMPMHLGFITSIANQSAFPPYYSILPETPVGYPFLCESVSSALYCLGLPLRFAYMLPSAFALCAVLLGGYYFFRQWKKDGRKAALAFFLFFVGGGFGLFYFLKGSLENPANFTRIFTAFYETPTNYVEENIRWVNPVADMLIPQRATLFGWTLLFACLFLLYRAAIEGEERCFLPLGVLAGCLPLVHTHSFLALGIVSAVLLLFSVAKKGVHWRTMRSWAVYATATLVLALPQLLFFTFKQSTGQGFLRFGWNWANDGDNYFWFYIKNIGLPYLLILPAFFKADKDSKKLYAGGLAILAICEVIIFQPNPYDNNKLLFVWHLFTCGLVAGYLVDVFDRLKKFRLMRAVAAVLAIALCTVSGALTLVREVVSDYELFSANDVALSEYVEENTPKDALFLTAINHNNAIAALCGRNVLCGSPSYLHYHGLDYKERQDAVEELYEKPSAEKLTAWGIDYVLISNTERRSYDVDEDWFAEHCEKVFEQGRVALYIMPEAG
jgi:hypothetical protein